MSRRNRPSGASAGSRFPLSAAFGLLPSEGRLTLDVRLHALLPLVRAVRRKPSVCLRKVHAVAGGHDAFKRGVLRSWLLLPVLGVV